MELDMKITLNSPEALSFVERAKAGDQEAMDRLVADNLGFILVPARRYSSQKLLGVDSGDLDQCAVIGFMKGIRRFDPSRFELRPYLLMAAHSAVVDFLRAEIRKGRNRENVDYSLDRIAISGPPDPLNDKDYVAVAIRLALLSKTEHDVVASIYGLGRPEESRTQIAARMGVSTARVRQILWEATERLKHAVTSRMKAA
jgi:RNA polymerase sigma factor (sigma-70 family)